MVARIGYSASSRIARISIDNPSAANALSREMMSSLAAAWRRAEDDPEVRVITISGVGKHFCSGADRSQLADSPGGIGKDFSPLDCGVAKPTIAAVNGAAVAAGMTLALSCDIVLASVTAAFSDPHTGYGLVGTGGPLWMSGVVPLTEIARVALADGVILGQRAYELGLVSELTSDSAHLAQVTEQYASRIAAKPQSSVQATMLLLRRLNAGTEYVQLFKSARQIAQAQASGLVTGNSIAIGSRESQRRPDT
jgi:enoyl-CoA hydratase/carnithine racemase